MKFCGCGNPIPNWMIIDGKRRNLSNRSRCLACQPFGSSRYCNSDRREARNTSARRHYNRFKAKHGTDPIKLRRNQRKAFLIASLGGQCPFCGYDRCQRNLVFHHLDGKKDRLTTRELQQEFGIIWAEIIKCVLCCHNCHGEIHDGLIPERRLKDEHLRLLAVFNPMYGRTWTQLLGRLECTT